MSVIPLCLRAAGAQLVAGCVLSIAQPAIACDTISNVFTKLIIHPGNTIAFEGDSITYAFDPTPSSGGKPGINGSKLPRSDAPFPELVGEMAKGTFRTVNRGFPGDRTRDALTRWQVVPVANDVFLQYGTNDFGNYGHYPDGPLSIEQFQTNLRALITRRRDQGSTVIVMLPPPIKEKSVDTRLEAFRCAAISTANQMGTDVFDTPESLRNEHDDWVDGLHLNLAANRTVANAIFSHIAIETP